MPKWQPGQSGNPSGRRKEVGPVRELAKQYTQAAIDTLAKVMEDPSAPPSARVAAAEALLARGWGKPQQAIEMSVQQVSPDGLKPDLAAIWLRAGVRLNSNGELESAEPESNPVSH
jgi:Flp pilus assembly protein TadD